MFTKQLFIDTILAIKNQMEFDMQLARSLSELYDCDINPHNNSRLINQLFKLLHCQFKPVGNYCPIQEFCFDLNFGEELESNNPIEDLWNELNK